MKVFKWNEVTLWQLATADSFIIDGDKKIVIVYGDMVELTPEEAKSFSYFF